MLFRDFPKGSLPVSLLQSAIAQERLSHAYLFSGPANSLKEEAAYALAQTLLCDSPYSDPPDACDKCPACQKVVHGNHPDIWTISPDGASLRIAQIRNLRTHLQRSAYQGKYSIAILHDADLMTTESANALLKILEEPLGPVVFILLSNQADTVPATIISRCQVLHFKALSLEKQSQLLAAEANGNPSRQQLALRYASHIGVSPKDLLTDPDGEASLDQIEDLEKAFFALFAKPDPCHPGEIFYFLKNYQREKEQLSFLLRLLRIYLTDLLNLSVNPEAQLHYPHHSQAYQSFSASSDQLLQAIAFVQTASQRIDANVDPYLVLATCLAQVGQTLRS